MGQDRHYVSSPECLVIDQCEATPMVTESRRYKGYVIDLVYNAPGWEAIIYPLSKLVLQLSPDLPPIHYKTKEKALEAACKRIDELSVLRTATEPPK
jgi:hypothetical protein